MSYERLEGPYAFTKTLEDFDPDESPDALLYAEAGICRRQKKTRKSKMEAKVLTASFQVGKVGTGVGASAQALSASYSEDFSDSIDLGGQTIDYKINTSAKGPSVGAEAKLGLTGVGAKVKAELASASSSVGVFAGKLGLAVDTGVNVGLDGVEATMMGTGASLWPHTGFTVFGSGISVDTQTIFQTIGSWF